MIKHFAGLFLSCIVLLPLAPAAFAAEEPDTLRFIPQGDQEMAKALTKAQASLDDFLAKYDNPPAGTESYSVKIGIADDGDGFMLTGLRDDIANVEYFWVGTLQRTPTGFTGILNNDPGVVRNVRAGQEITFTRNDIFDWMYIKDGKIVGNVTACPILLRGPKEELEYYRQNYGLEC